MVARKTTVASTGRVTVVWPLRQSTIAASAATPENTCRVMAPPACSSRVRPGGTADGGDELHQHVEGGQHVARPAGRGRAWSGAVETERSRWFLSTARARLVRRADVRIMGSWPASPQRGGTGSGQPEHVRDAAVALLDLLGHQPRLVQLGDGPVQVVLALAPAGHVGLGVVAGRGLQRATSSLTVVGRPRSTTVRRSPWAVG